VPTWAWILVTLVAAVGSGLLATIVNVSKDRVADARRRMVDAVEAVAVSATDWFDAVREAVDARERHHADADASQPAYEAAAAHVQDARRKVNRLWTVVPYGSALGTTSNGFLGFLQMAVEELDPWPPEYDDDSDDDVPEAGDYDAESGAIEDAIAEARVCHGFALEGFQEFTRVAAAEAHSPYFNVRRFARLPARRGSPS
jgi:hypothetical protein